MFDMIRDACIQRFRREPQRRDPGYSEASLPDADFVAKQNFSGRSFPTSVASCRDHKATCWVKIELRDDSGAMAGYNQEGYCSTLDAGFLLLLLTEIVQSENIIRSAGVC